MDRTFCLSAGDILGQPGDGAEAMYFHATALGKVQRAKAPAGTNLRLDHAAAAWIETGTHEPKLERQAHQVEIGAPGHIEKMIARAGENVSAADQDELARS